MSIGRTYSPRPLLVVAAWTPLINLTCFSGLRPPADTGGLPVALRVIPGQKTGLGPAESLLEAYRRTPVGADEHTGVRLVETAGVWWPMTLKTALEAQGNRPSCPACWARTCGTALRGLHHAGARSPLAHSLNAENAGLVAENGKTLQFQAQNGKHRKQKLSAFVLTKEYLFRGVSHKGRGRILCFRRLSGTLGSGQMGADGSR